MDNRQTFNVQMDAFYKQLDSLSREFPLRVASRVSNDSIFQIEGDVKLRGFVLATVSFSFESLKWQLYRNMQPILYYNTIEQAISQIRSDYADLFLDLIDWRVYGGAWKDILR